MESKIKSKTLSGLTTDKDKFHQKTIDGVKYLIQQNRLDEWHGYINQIWCCSFISEVNALKWFHSI